MSKGSKRKVRSKRSKDKAITTKKDEKPIKPEIPLEDKPRSMVNSTSHGTSFDVPEPLEKPVKVKKTKDEPQVQEGQPVHFKCGGVLAMFGDGGLGLWWECARCTSQFFFDSRKRKGIIGDPEEAKVIYKYDARSRNKRRW